MTEIELFDRLNPKRDLSQATCDVIRRVYEVMSKETEELKNDIEARKFAMAMSGKVEKQLRTQIEKMKCCENCQTVCDVNGNCYQYKDGKCNPKDKTKWEMKK